MKDGTDTDINKLEDEYDIDITQETSISETVVKTEEDSESKQNKEEDNNDKHGDKEEEIDIKVK